MTTPTTGAQSGTTSTETGTPGAAPAEGATGGTGGTEGAPGTPPATPTTPDPKPASETPPATPPPGEGAKPPEGEKKPDDAPPAELELKVPEGVALDPALIDGFKPVFKDLGLDSEKAQKLVDHFAASQKARVAQLLAEHQAQEASWREAVRADKELGGTAFEATEKDAARALSKFGTPALTEFFETSGYGSHPELVRLLARVGKALAEDSVADSANLGKPPPRGDDAFLRQMYDHPSSAALLPKE